MMDRRLVPGVLIAGVVAAAALGLSGATATPATGATPAAGTSGAVATTAPAPATVATTDIPTTTIPSTEPATPTTTIPSTETATPTTTIPSTETATSTTNAASTAPASPTTNAASAQAEPVAADPSVVSAGHALYVQACSSCHGIDGHGMNAYPTLENVGPAAVDWWISTGRMPLAGGVGQAPRKVAAFDAKQRAAIVAYVATLVPGGPVIPPVDPGAGSLDAGGASFRLNCAACHGVAGVGGALAHGAYAPSLRKATALQIAEAMRIGPDNMPVFDRATLSDTDVNNIVRYVAYLRHPDDRGGAGLGHVGPIAEGLVGLLLGLGVLLMVSYWIGDRTGAEQ